MAIKDLYPKQGKVDLIAEVIEKGEVREFEKFGQKGRVCNAKIKDQTGEIKLTLWNEDIDRVNVGDTIHIKNGYVSEFQGEMQLSAGKYGSMEVIGKTDEGEQILTGDERLESDLLNGKTEEDVGPTIPTKKEELGLEEEPEVNEEDVKLEEE
ncbi:hypothetical protein DRJ17_01400 [Candidatus Woesearchaeota archaeon]|nr:MAG: hypothetical protein DRJ17_01400 [Candidatus Woesearchaeota archaeon]